MRGSPPPAPPPAPESPDATATTTLLPGEPPQRWGAGRRGAAGRRGSAGAGGAAELHLTLALAELLVRLLLLAPPLAPSLRALAAVAALRLVHLLVLALLLAPTALPVAPLLHRLPHQRELADVAEDVFEFTAPKQGAEDALEVHVLERVVRL